MCSLRSAPTPGQRDPVLELLVRTMRVGVTYARHRGRRIDARRVLEVVMDLLSMAAFYTTAFRRAASRNHSALSFGIRCWVSKST